MGMFVSVVIPTHNRGEMLLRSVESVLNQTCQDFELIVVDDCSKDTRYIEQAISLDKRIRQVRHDSPKGGSEARNTGIRMVMYSLTTVLSRHSLLTSATSMLSDPALVSVSGTGDSSYLIQMIMIIQD